MILLQFLSSLFKRVSGERFACSAGRIASEEESKTEMDISYKYLVQLDFKASPLRSRDEAKEEFGLFFLSCYIPPYTLHCLNCRTLSWLSMM